MRKKRKHHYKVKKLANHLAIGVFFHGKLIKKMEIIRVMINANGELRKRILPYKYQRYFM